MEATITIATQESQNLFLGNGVTSEFDVSFVMDSANYILVTYIDANGNQTVLTSSQYTLSINSPAAGELWGIGGSVTYPVSGSPMANGEMLLVQRTVPFQQLITISNQGDFAPEVIEEALDTLEMELQQIAARTGQFRGTWATGVIYNYGDMVIDGVNGNNTGNWYFCIVTNTSGTWATDLSNNYWQLALVIPSTSATSPTALTANTQLVNLPVTQTFSNAGAAGSVVATLPSVCSGSFLFYVAAAETFQIQANTGQYIVNANISSSEGGNFNFNTVGDLLGLVAVTSNKWAVTTITGVPNYA